MTVFFAGDWHGNTAWAEHAISTAGRAGCDRVVHVGDFGIWPGSRNGIDKFAYNVSGFAERAGVHVYFVDGNHDFHGWLREQLLDPDTGMVPLFSNLVYLPRGCRWVWDDTRFLALGGAYSIDRPWRVEGRSWWPEETITDAEVGVCGVEPVDVLVSHDCPAGVDPFGQGTVGEKDAYPESWANRLRLRTVVDRVRPKLVVHGHYHARTDSPLDIGGHVVRVVGLNRDWRAHSFVVKDGETVLIDDQWRARDEARDNWAVIDLAALADRG